MLNNRDIHVKIEIIKNIFTIFGKFYTVTIMKISSILILTLGLIAYSCKPGTQSKTDSSDSAKEFSGIPLDSIILSDPAILPDSASGMYYMTGTGGQLWKSPDLKVWQGPMDVVEVDSSSWMGAYPMIWAAELHQYNGKYYYFATFTNRDIKFGTYKGNELERRSSHILVADNPEGPYRHIEGGDSVYLSPDKLTLDGTFWVDRNGKPYMVYCWEWLQNWDGTIEKIELKPDLSGSVGEESILFRASESPWSLEIDENGKERPNKVTDGPYIFRTDTGKLGMIWTSWVKDVYTQGVAYSESGTLDGPWTQVATPITPPNFGHGMLFRTFDGQLLMSVHSHKSVDGRYIRVPHLFKADISGDSLIIGEKFNN